MTPERLARFLDCEVVGTLFPVCGNQQCANLTHWFFSKGDGRQTSTRWKELRVLTAHQHSPHLSVSGLAEAAGVSPRFVRATLERNELPLPKEGVGADGKTYSTSRAAARLRALRRALEAALPHLDGVGLDAANELLETLKEQP